MCLRLMLASAQVGQLLATPTTKNGRRLEVCPVTLTRVVEHCPQFTSDASSRCTHVAGLLCALPQILLWATTSGAAGDQQLPPLTAVRAILPACGPPCLLQLAAASGSFMPRCRTSRKGAEQRACVSVSSSEVRKPLGHTHFTLDISGSKFPRPSQTMRTSRKGTEQRARTSVSSSELRKPLSPARSQLKETTRGEVPSHRTPLTTSRCAPMQVTCSQLFLLKNAKRS